MNDTLKAALKGAAIGLPVSIVASLLAQHGVNADVLKNSQPGELPTNIPEVGSAPLAPDTEALKLPHLGELKVNVPKFGIAALGTAAGAALGAGAHGAKFVKDAVIETSINRNRLLNAQRQVLRENGLLRNVEKPLMAGKKDYDYVVNHNPRPYQLRPYQQRPYQPARNRDELLKIDTVKDVTPNYPVVTEPEKSRQFSIVGGGLKLISAGVSGLGNLVGIADAAGKGAKVVQKVGQALANNVSDSINIKNPILNSVANGVGTTIKYQLIKPTVTKASSNPFLQRQQASGFSETIVPNSMLSDLDSAQIACINNDANLEDSVGARKDLINDRLDSLLTPATLKLNQATTLQGFSEGDFNFITDIGKSIGRGSIYNKLALGAGALAAATGLISAALTTQKTKKKETDAFAISPSAEDPSTIANAAGFSEGDFNFVTNTAESIGRSSVNGRDPASGFVYGNRLPIGAAIGLGKAVALLTVATILALKTQKAKKKELTMSSSAEDPSTIANAGFSEGDFNFVTDIGKSIWKGVKRFGVGLGIGKDKFGQDIKDSLSKGVDNASKSLSDNLTNLGEKAREAHNKVLESSLKSATPGSDAARDIEKKISDNLSKRNIYEKTADATKVGSAIAKSVVGSIPNTTATQVAVGASKMMNNRLKESKANADEATARAKNAQATA